MPEVRQPWYPACSAAAHTHSTSTDVAIAINTEVVEYACKGAEDVFAPSEHSHNLRGWRIYAYEISWPSAVISAFLLAMAHFVYPAQLENWHYNVHNEWSFDFREKMQEIVPISLLIVFAILCALVMVAAELGCVRSGTRAHRIIFAINLFIGMWDAFLIALTFTEFAKKWVSEPRPDFRERCLGSINATAQYGPDGAIVCTGNAADIEDGRYAFPSGHASASAAVGMYASCYFVWLVYLRAARLPWRTTTTWVSAHVRQAAHTLIMVCVLPLAVAFFIAGSRIVDHRHSPTDVTAGCLLGLVFGALVFARVVSESRDSVLDE